jgi:hypothetical protein
MRQHRSRRFSRIPENIKKRGKKLKRKDFDKTEYIGDFSSINPCKRDAMPVAEQV